MIPIFVGYDEREAVVYHTFCNSVIRHASEPVLFFPLKRSLLGPLHKRSKEKDQSNEFSFTRFLVPALSGFAGHALFCDGDMLCLDDIVKLWNLRDARFAVQVVKHDYEPKDETKYLGAKQYKYPRKNWSSVMLFNCEHPSCRRLSYHFVDTAPGSELHQFRWCRNDEEIGSLPKEWNHLVSEYSADPNAKLVHYTVGGPYFSEYEDCDYNKEWFHEFGKATFAEQVNGGKMGRLVDIGK